jgi:hypothetical protein
MDISALAVQQQKLKEVVSQLESRSRLSGPEREQRLNLLEEFECWNPYFRILSRELNLSQTDKFEIFLRLARAQNLYLDDNKTASKTVAKMVKDLKLGFDQLKRDVLSLILVEEDHVSEANILEAASSQFSNKADLVRCVEHLCMLYEKKIYHEAKLAASYERLLQIAPENVKALRYFKMVCSQNQQWEKTSNILATLLKALKHKQEKYRVAHELATVLLYYLDRPEQAIQVIETYCQHSPLDTTAVLYDGYTRLSNWEGCIKTLKICSESEMDRNSLAILNFKIGEMYELLKKPTKAVQHYQMSMETDLNFLEPIEALLRLKINDKKWNEVKMLLHELSKRIVSKTYKDKVEEATVRLTDGLSHGVA